jgi:prophage regulatory protein
MQYLIVSRSNPSDIANDVQDGTEVSIPCLYRLSEVLKQIPISRSSWLAGVKTGRYPGPVHLSIRRVAWRRSDIEALIRSL